MAEKWKFALYKLSYLKYIKLSLRYSTNNSKHFTILSIEELSDLKNKEDMIAKYIIERIDLGLHHNLNDIHSVYLAYSY